MDIRKKINNWIRNDKLLFNVSIAIGMIAVLLSFFSFLQLSFSKPYVNSLSAQRVKELEMNSNIIKELTDELSAIRYLNETKIESIAISREQIEKSLELYKQTFPESELVTSAFLEIDRLSSEVIELRSQLDDATSLLGSDITELRSAIAGRDGERVLASYARFAVIETELEFVNEKVGSITDAISNESNATASKLDSVNAKVWGVAYALIAGLAGVIALPHAAGAAKELKAKAKA